MKKLVLLLMCLSLVMVSPAVLAGNMEAVGGMTVNTFDLTMSEEEVAGSQKINDVGHGNGLYIGGRYWFSDKMAAGIGYDYITSNPNMRYEELPYYDEFGVKIDMKGLYGEVVYQLTDYIKLKGDLANYNMTADYYEEENVLASEEDEITGSGMGYIIGGEMNYPIKDDLSLNSSLGYRTASLTIDEPEDTMPDPLVESGDMEVDVKGLFFSLGLNMAF